MMLTNYIVGLSALFAIISVTNAFNVGRINEVKEVAAEIMKPTDELNQLTERIKIHSVPIIQKMSKIEQKKFFKDFAKLHKANRKMGEDAGVQMAEGKFNEQTFTTTFDNFKKQEKSKSYFNRLEQTVGEKNLNDMLDYGKRSVMKMATKLRERGIIQK